MESATYRIGERMGLGLHRGRTAVLRTLSGVRERVPIGVALTFDDGPMPGTTDALLDLLARLEVRATFFCVGRNAEQNPGLLLRMITDGHVIGSHSLTHAPVGAQAPRALALDYVAGRRAVEDASGRLTPLFRPPYGRLTAGTSRLLRSWDSWTWAVDPRDWRPEATAASIVSALHQVSDRDVVLLHDWLEPRVPHSTDRSPTLAAVEHTVAGLRRRGIPLVTLPMRP